MSSSLNSYWHTKHAWSEILRRMPPKRSVVERVADFLEVYSSYNAQQAMEQAQRCIQCPQPLCVANCPLSNRIPEWLALTAEGQFLEAAEISGLTSNMPEICSRLCPQERLCESGCIIAGRAEAVSIGAVEKFINEYAFAHELVTASVAPPNGFKVAVIGAGPAGLACADELAKKGYAVTVFDSQPLPGGLLVYGIPAFKLEKSIVARRVQILERRGVVFRLGVTIGQDLGFDELRRDYDAIFIGFGAQQAKPLDIPGADLQGVHQALPFLVQRGIGIPTDLPPIEVAGKRVAILGGGDTAMDCLRTAVRCGATETVCLYRRDMANMPGSRKEYLNALEEGAQFMFLTIPVALLADAAGQVRAVRCQKAELGPPDASGRRSPRAVKGSEFEVLAELVLVAYGFDAVPFPTVGELAQIARDKWGTLIVDADQMTSLPGVFAGGDIVRGPSLVVHAVRDARQAATSIDRYLRGDPQAATAETHLEPATA